MSARLHFARGLPAKLDRTIVVGQDAVTGAIGESHRRGLPAHLLGIVGRVQVPVDGGRRRGSISRMERQHTAPVRRLGNAADHLRNSVRLAALAKCK